MKPIDENQRNRYFTELAVALKREGLETMPLKDWQLPVLMDGHPICQISGGGNVRYRPEDVAAETMEQALQKATDTEETVSEYMGLMEAAPILKAQGLDEDYKQLADFNGVVLAGHPTRFGVQFVTWDWDYGRTGVSQGHYMSNNYEAAKKDFSVRSGLIQKRQLFSAEQHTEIYRCASNELDNNFNLTYEQEKSIDNIRIQIRSLVPDLDERLKTSQTVSQQTEQTM